MATIKVSVNFSNLKHGDFLIRCHAIYNGMKSSVSIFPNPPVELELLKATTDEYEDAMTRAVDSRVAKSERDALRTRVKMQLKQLAAYVEASAKDISEVLASGFEPAYVSRRPSGPLEPAVMKKLVHGATSGSIDAYIKPLEDAHHYELGHAEYKLQTAEGEWSVQIVFAARFPITVRGLTTGTVYAFRVRAHGMAGPTDWSDPMTIMCV